MKLIFDSMITSNRLRELVKQADDKIHIRGFSTECDVPVELRNPNWFLPFNEIPIKYCPTDRYSYLNKYKRSVPRRKSWEILQGGILDDLYDEFIKTLNQYLNETTNLNNTNVIKGLQEFNDRFLECTRLKIRDEKPMLLNPPNAANVKKMIKSIEKILRYEIELASALVDYKLSIVESLDISSIPMTLFPFVPKPSYTVGSFGITTTAQPDFLFDNRIVVDVKSPPWNDDFLFTLGGYALVYERANYKPMDLGMIITPEPYNDRNVPSLFRSDIVMIDDICRQGFLLRRDHLLEKMKASSDPGIPETDSKCKTCGYYNHCWPSL